MSVERKTQVINATGRAELARGNYFLLLTSTASVDVRADRDGTSEGFNGIIGGFLIKRVKPWDQMIVVGAAGDVIEYIVGSEAIVEDETDIRLGVSAIAGTVSTVERPSDTVSDLAPVVLASGVAAIIVPSSTTRRRMRVQVDPAGASGVFVRTAAGGNNLTELQPGALISLDTFDELWGFQASGVAVTVYRLEEI